MKVSINVEFTDDELVKHAENVGRRIVLSAIHDVIKHLPALKEIPPGVVSGFVQGAMDALHPRKAEEPQGRIDATFGDETPLPSRCERIASVQRSLCRNCDHERCDVVIPPAPDEAHTGSA